MQLMGYDFSIVNRAGAMLPEFYLLSRYNGRVELYREKIMTATVPVTAVFLSGKIYFTSKMLLNIAPTRPADASVYSATIELVGWIYVVVGDLASVRQRIMTEMCPELAPLLKLGGLIFPDLTEDQMCLHESPDITLYLRAFEAALPM
jgi:hypothetical protein